VFCQSFPFLLFSYFCFSLLSDFFRSVCCALSASVTCSHSPMHFVAEGSASLFLTSLHLPPFGCCCCLFLGLFVCLFVWIYSRNRRKSGTVGSIWKYPNIDECRRLFRCVGNVSLVMSQDQTAVQTRRCLENERNAIKRFASR
jgi:hypothetical protein